MGAVAPWWLGFALAVSIPADAGQEALSGVSQTPWSWRMENQPAELIPRAISAPAGDFGGLSGEAGRVLREASLALGESEEFKRLPEEIEPRADLKRNVKNFPDVDRSRKGDPVVGLRPTFDTKLRRPGGFARLRADDLLFRHDDVWPTSGFAEFDGESSAFDRADAFEPWPDGESPTTARASGEASPRQSGLTMTMRPAAINERLLQGATPAVRRAAALASTTPAAADSTPVEVAAPPDHSNASFALRSEERPDFASRVDQDQSAKEKRCLAEAIYFEARSEPEEGQAAVAQVVLNRVSSGLYPTTICGVVYQNRHRWRACQFSFACEGKSLRVTEPEAWRTAVRIADEVTTGRTYVSDVGGATHYHANYVRPRWARKLEKMDVIGHHIFYKLRPGQT